MPIRVATIDLTGAVVGTPEVIRFGQAVPPPTLAQQMNPRMLGPITLKIYNESGCGFTCTWPENNQSFTIPAGQWPTLYPPPNETQLNVTVFYVLPNAPVNQLAADLFLPGEQVYETGALGNSPVNGGVTTMAGSSPVIVFQAINQPILSTTTQLYIYTPLVNAMYRANLHFTYRNATPQKVIAKVGFFDVTLAINTHATFMLESPDSNLGQFLTGTQASTTGNNQTASCAPITFYAGPGGAIVLNWQDPGGTPNDVVSFVVESISI